MSQYNSLTSIGFSIVHSDKDANDVTGADVRRALMRRIEELDSNGDIGWLEAIGSELADTYEDEDSSGDSASVSESDSDDIAEKTPPLNDLRCPSCDSNQIEGDSFDGAMNEVWQRMSCHSCPHEWTALYRYVGVQQEPSP